MPQKLRACCVAMLFLTAAACGGSYDEADPSLTEPSMATDTNSVIGGTTTSGYPSAVRLKMYYCDNIFDCVFGHTFYCTGTVVAPDIVMTAAHCVEDLVNHSTRWITVLDANVAVTAWSMNSAYATTHKEKDDAAILFLQSSLSTSTYTPVTVKRPADTVASGAAGTIVGFGCDNSNGSGSGVKREGSVNVYTMTDTPPYWHLQGGAGGCYGDSGGPTYVVFDDGYQPQLRAIGIHSTADIQSQTWDADMSQYYSWINSWMSGRCDSGQRSSTVCTNWRVLPAPTPICGDGRCVSGETASSCRADCGYCGDGVCYGSEYCGNCSTDCGSCGGGGCGPYSMMPCITGK